MSSQKQKKKISDVQDAPEVQYEMSYTLVNHDDVQTPIVDRYPSLESVTIEEVHELFEKRKRDTSKKF
jgi:hypothetical protein